jgi:predicted DNA-binding transcriptional regulator AlpA
LQRDQGFPRPTKINICDARFSKQEVAGWMQSRLALRDRK